MLIDEAPLIVNSWHIWGFSMLTVFSPSLTMLEYSTLTSERTREEEVLLV